MSVPLLRQHVLGSGEIARTKTPIEGFVVDGVLGVLPGHHLGYLVVPHVVEQLGEVERCDVGLQRPGGVGVPDHKRKVGHVTV